MARIGFWGWESESTAEIQGVVGDVTVVSSPVHSGHAALKVHKVAGETPWAALCGSTSAYLRSLTTAWALTTMYKTFYVRFSAWPDPGPPGEAEGFYWFSSLANPAHLRLTSAGKIDLYDSGVGGALLVAGTTSLAVDTWHRIDIKHSKGAAGACNYELWLNGVLEYSGSNGTFGTASITSVRIGVYKEKAPNSSIDFWFDDAVADDAAFPTPGTLGIARCNVDAQGNYTNCAGTYLDVDENPTDEDTTYVAADAQEEKETVGFDTSSIPSGAILLSAKGLFAIKGDGYTYGVDDPEIVFLWRSGGTDYQSAAAQPPTAQYEHRASPPKDIDPKTSAAWSLAGLDALELGIYMDFNTDGGTIRCSTINLHVLYHAVILASATLTGRGTASLSAVVISAGAATATGVGTASSTPTVAASGSSTATGRGLAALIALVISVCSSTATGIGTAEAIGTVHAAATATATGRGTAFCDAEVQVGAGASATATGRGTASCALRERSRRRAPEATRSPWFTLCLWPAFRSMRKAGPRGGRADV
jgi:hypothetical protein